ncbi:lamin tail domain-containing protein [Paenibacillus cisolokensis]|uniref:lamin tail domain-containing protein n=1 Tax=Paenibacillus cisolokensis TaxID=1658519 RepID=UPI003D2AD4A9
MMRQLFNKAPAAILLAATMLWGIAGWLLPPSAQASSSAYPYLLITEVTPDSLRLDGHSGTPDAFEFIELYNHSPDPINLNGYKIIYETPTVYRWPIQENKVIQPYGTMVLWIKSVPEAALADFNRNYGTQLEEERVYEIFAAGMANSSSRKLTIAAPDETPISTVSYTAADVHENVGIPYLYPVDGSITMRKLADTDPATPGSIFPGQAPPDELDDEAPSAPSGVAAIPGEGSITLTWQANPESDLAFYHVYTNGSLSHILKGSRTSLTLTQLLEGTAYTFELSAVDVANNESAKSSAVEAAPVPIRITQDEIGIVPPGEFPEYDTFFRVSEPGPVIPGLLQDLVPQGIAYVPELNGLLVSHYRNDGNPSVLTVIDAQSGELVKSLHLYNEDNTPYTGHAGGVTVSRSHVWISSGGKLFRLPLDELVDAPDGAKLKFAGHFETGTRSSFAVYADGMIWAGEFAAQGYETDPSHEMTNRDGELHKAWMTGFRLDEETDMLPDGKQPPGGGAVTPDYVLSIPDKIQGAAIYNGTIALSQSYGRNNDATLLVYPQVYQDAPHRYVQNGGEQIPVWFLDGQSERNRLTAPPLSEGIIEHNGILYVLFESGATEYRTSAKYPLDRIRMLDLQQLASGCERAAEQ